MTKRETRLWKRLENLEKSLPKKLQNSAYYLMHNYDNDINRRIFEEKNNVKLSKTTITKLGRMRRIIQTQMKRIEQKKIKQLSDLEEKDLLFSKHLLKKTIYVQVKLSAQFPDYSKDIFYVSFQADNQKEFEQLLDEKIFEIERKYKVSVLNYQIVNIYINRLYKTTKIKTIYEIIKGGK